MKKTLYIIPGFGESVGMTPYPKIITVAKSNGYKVVTYNPKWSHAVATDWIQGLNNKLKKEKSEHVSVLGFSLGAYTALSVAQNFHFKKIIVCSPSPFFKDDIRHMSRSAWKFLGKRRMQDFSKYRFPTNIKTEIVFMVGEMEKIPDSYMKNIDKRYRMCAGKKKKVIVPSAEHDLSSGDYLRAIEKELKG
jgi:esterase/lipase